MFIKTQKELINLLKQGYYQLWKYPGGYELSGYPLSGYPLRKVKTETVEKLIKKDIIFYNGKENSSMKRFGMKSLSLRANHETQAQVKAKVGHYL